MQMATGAGQVHWPRTVVVLHVRHVGRAPGRGRVLLGCVGLKFALCDVLKTPKPKVPKPNNKQKPRHRIRVDFLILSDSVK